MRKRFVVRQNIDLPLIAAAALVLTGCGRNMVQQARYDPYERGLLFPDGMAMQPPPQGTVARDAPLRAAAARRPALTRALLRRGRDRFAIYCAPCHARDGSGRGVVPSRGFPHPPDFREPRLRRADARHFYTVITHGYGVMYAYADRVAPPDRWAIAGWIRVLQQTGKADDAQR